MWVPINIGGSVMTRRQILGGSTILVPKDSHFPLRCLYLMALSGTVGRA